MIAVICRLIFSKKKSFKKTTKQKASKKKKHQTTQQHFKLQSCLYLTFDSLKTHFLGKAFKVNLPMFSTLWI